MQYDLSVQYHYADIYCERGNEPSGFKRFREFFLPPEKQVHFQLAAVHLYWIFMFSCTAHCDIIARHKPMKRKIFQINTLIYFIKF